MSHTVEVLICRDEHFEDDIRDLHIMVDVDFIPDSFSAFNVAGDLQEYPCTETRIEVAEITYEDMKGVWHPMDQDMRNKKPELMKLIAKKINRAIEDTSFDDGEFDEREYSEED